MDRCSVVTYANGLGPTPTGGTYSPIANVPVPTRSYRGGAAFEDSEGGLAAWEGGEAVVLMIFGASSTPFGTSKARSTIISVSVALPDAALPDYFRPLSDANSTMCGAGSLTVFVLEHLAQHSPRSRRPGALLPNIRSIIWLASRVLTGPAPPC